VKVIGHYSLRGRIPESEWNKALPILLDYGDMKVAYRITSFLVSMPEAATAGDDCFGKLATTDTIDTTADHWFWDDNREIAWTHSNVSATGRRGLNFIPTEGIIDGDNLVVEDLYLVIGSDTSSEDSVNYMIEMEKLQVSPEVTIMTQVNQVN
jgi:hypothetical protein